MDKALWALARRAGIAAEYADQTGQRRTTSEETARALLTAMGYDVSGPAQVSVALAAAESADQDSRLPGYVVAVVGEAPELDPGEDEWRIEAEDGATRDGRGPLPGLPIGRHKLTVAGETCWILSAPRALPMPDRGWGVTLPLYGLRGPARGGLADYRDLASAVAGLGEVGAGFVGINPVHAGFAADPAAISPYSPSHRRRFSTAHLCAPLEEGPGGGGLIDYPAALAARRTALEATFRAFEDRDGAFAAYRAGEGGSLERFAIFEALAEVHGPRWDSWPKAYAAPDTPAVQKFARDSAERVSFHAWMQFQAERQLAEVAAAARDRGMAQGLYLDLAVGTHPFGAETWAERGCFAFGVSLGAPPDSFSEDGQVWNVAPFNPRHLVSGGFGPLASTLRAQLKFAGMLRIDHILGFDRAFWVPQEGGAGTYVQMPKSGMLATARIEAARAGAVIVGEDLGNIPEGLQDDLAASGVLGCRVAIFEGGRRAGSYPERVLTSFGTHDLPTWLGWREGLDIDAREEIGGIDHAAAEQARAERRKAVSKFAEAVGSESPNVDDVHRHLAQTPSRLVALQAEDVLGVADQPNLPGTTDEYPNWRRRLPVDAQDLGCDPRVRRAAEIMAAEDR